MSYYILPKTNNDLYVNPRHIDNKKNDNSYLLPYVSNTLYNYYNDITDELKSFFLHNNNIS